MLEPQIVEQSQRLSGEPAQLTVAAFSLQFADHHQRDHHLVFGEPTTCPRVGQQHGSVDHVGPDFGHVALLERDEPARLRASMSAGTATPGPGPVLALWGPEGPPREPGKTLTIDDP